MLSLGLQAQAQGTTSVEVWPELSTFIRMSAHTRLYLLATTVKEHRDSISGEFGPNLDVYVRPIAKRKHWAGFRLDESKNRVLMIRIGYRYLPTYGSDDPAENRGVLEGTARFPLAGGLLVSNRSRIDLRFVDGTRSWRYRNRLSFERELSVGTLLVNPYVRAELFFDSRVHAWSRTGFIAGAAVPAGRHLEFESYYTYEHDTGGSANHKLHAIGAVVNLYLP